MDLLIFALGAMIGVLAGGALVVRRFRAAIAGDIGPPIRRMHAEIDPSSAACRTSSTTSSPR